MLTTNSYNSPLATRTALKSTSSFATSDPTLRRSNLVIRGVVSSVRRELKPITANNTNNTTQTRGNNANGDDGNGGDYSGSDAFLSGAGGGGYYDHDGGGGHVEAGEVEHVATFVLDASEGAANHLLQGGVGVSSSTANTTAGAAASSKLMGSSAMMAVAPSSPGKGGITAASLLAAAAAKPPANTVTLRLAGDWALSTSFVGVGDIIEASQFDVDSSGAHAGGSMAGGYSSGYGSPSASSSTGLVIVANNCTEINVTRMKKVAINARNVGQLELLELTDREQADARHAFSNIPPQRFGDKNTFSQVDIYYDIIKGQSEMINPHMTFLQSLFGFRTSILDAGCGSGLYSFAFRGYGVYPVCVDASHVMQRRFEEKNRFFQQAEAQQKRHNAQYNNNTTGGNSVNAMASTTSGNPTFEQQQQFQQQRQAEGGAGGGGTVPPHFMGSGMAPNTAKGTLMARKAQKALALRGTSELEFHLADLASFSLARRDVDGNLRYTDFEGVLCLDVLALLPDVDAVRAALHNLSLHTAKGGIAVISFPNSTVALDKGSYMSTMAYEMDRFKLSVGAVSTPQGTLHLTETVLLEMPPSTLGGGIGAAGRLLSGGGSATNSPAHYSVSGLPSANTAALGPSSVRPFGLGANGSSTSHAAQHNNSDVALPKRVTTWRGTAYHPTATGAADKFVPFVEHFTEMLMPAGLIEAMLEECGYTIRALYGTLSGDAFIDLVSENRYYVLQRSA